MLSFPASSCATLLKGFFYSSKGPFRGLYFNPENAFVFFPVSTFQGGKSAASSFVPCNKCHHGISLAPSILWLVLRTTACFASSACSRNFLTLFSFSAKVFPRSTYVWFFSHQFPKPSTVRLSSSEISPLPICQWFFSFCLQRLVVTLLAQIGRA